MDEGRYQNEISQSWGHLRKESAPPKKTKSQRGKAMSGKLLIEVVAYAARDAGLMVFYRSHHRRSFYLKKAGSQFKLRISDHQFSKGSKERHMSVILNYIVTGPMDAKDAIALGRRLANDYAEKCRVRLMAGA